MLNGPESDSEDELPPGWEERSTVDGKVFFANRINKTTQWTHPRTGKEKRLPENLPFGWERQILDDGNVIYVDKENNRTSYTDPRLAFPVESSSKKDETLRRKLGSGFRQKFDASSTAMQVLHGINLKGKVTVITGASSGIGLETAKSLALHGSTIVMGVRDVLKAEEEAVKIRKIRPGADIQVLHCDLAKLSSVALFARDVKTRYEKIDCLILNAGVFGRPFNLTEDCLDETFQVNFLAQFYLTSLLLESLAASKRPKVVFVSAESHRFSRFAEDGKRLENFDPSFKPSDFTAIDNYNDSKFFNACVGLEACLKWKKFGIRSYAVHPGNMVNTGLPKNSYFYRFLFGVLVRPWTKTLQQAASSTVFAGFSPDLEDPGFESRGIYVSNNFPTEPAAAVEDQSVRNKVWEMAENLLKLRNLL